MNETWVFKKGTTRSGNDTHSVDIGMPKYRTQNNDEMSKGRFNAHS